ncbi:MAG: sugar phosphate isomerase/epimerase [Clostridiales bacterium]|nr:sugar phosphate isomerase/epimerase [Clostridiales bacterium]
MTIGLLTRLESGAMDHKLKQLADNGFDNCQLVSWSPADWTDENAKEVITAADKYKITITGFWCGWEGPVSWNFYEGQENLGLVPPTYRYVRMKNLMAGADFAKKMGITDVISHMGYIPENPYDPNYSGFIVAMKTVANYLKKQGQYLLFETGQETPVTLLRTFEDIGTDNLGVNLDTGNLICYGKANPVDSLDVIGKYVRNIHAKDCLYPTNGRNLGREVELGQGKANFPAFLKKLKEIGYTGPITIEREIKDDKDAFAAILKSRDFLDNIRTSL